MQKYTSEYIYLHCQAELKQSCSSTKISFSVSDKWWMKQYAVEWSTGAPSSRAWEKSLGVHVANKYSKFNWVRKLLKCLSVLQYNVGLYIGTFKFISAHTHCTHTYEYTLHTQSHLEHAFEIIKAEAHTICYGLGSVPAAIKDNHVSLLHRYIYFTCIYTVFSRIICHLHSKAEVFTVPTHAGCSWALSLQNSGRSPKTTYKVALTDIKKCGRSEASSVHLAGCLYYARIPYIHWKMQVCINTCIRMCMCVCIP